MRAIQLLIFLSCIGLTSPLSATALDDARVKFQQGDFVAAAEQARELVDIEAKVLAAQAYLAEAGYVAQGEAAKKLLMEALTVTDEALALDPNHIEAILYRVIAVGYDSRVKGIWTSQDEGHGQITKALIARAIELDPNNAWALMVSSGWHAEIVDGAGALMANWMFGASRKKAISNCESAVRIEPDGLPFLVECARTLLRLSSLKYQADVRQYLTAAMALTPVDRFEALVQGHGRQLLAAVDTNDKVEIQRVFKSLDAFRQ